MVVCKAMLALRNPAVNAVPLNKMLIISLHINVRRTSVSGRSPTWFQPLGWIDVALRLGTCFLVKHGWQANVSECDFAE